MKTIDCTPPENLPDEVIINGGETYHLRVKTEKGSDHVELNEVTLPGAVQKAVHLGFNPTHYIQNIEIGSWYQIPKSIVRSSKLT